MTVTDAFTIDGVNDATFLIGDGTFTDTLFAGGFMGYLNQYIVGDALDTTISLAGSNWTLGAMQIGADDGSHVTINDTDNSAGRRIIFLELGESSDINLISTQIDFLLANSGGDHDITLGSGYTRYVGAFGDNNTITTGDGYVRAIELANSSTVDVNGDVGSIETYGDTVVRVDGNVNSIALREGDNTLRLNSGFVVNIQTSGETTDAIVKSNFAMDFFKANGGLVDLTVKDGGRIDFFEANGADTSIVMEGEGRVRKFQSFEGTNDYTTGTRWIDSFNSWESVNTIHIGSGGIGSLTMGSDSALHHSITADGYVQSLAVYESDTVDLTVGDGGGGAFFLGDGNDTVVTGNAFVDLIDLGAGNDVISIGFGGVGRAAGGDGDDVFFVQAIDFATFVEGGAGNDTLDFSSFTTKVKFSLDEFGQYQNVSNPSDPTVPAEGYFAEASIENLIGGKKRDDLKGDSADNFLKGRGGKDILRGGEGDDTLRGDGAGDTFVFGENGGTDVIEDFDQSEGDRIKIQDHAGGFGALGISDVNGDREITYDGGTILLEDQAGLVLTSSDFVFV